MTTPLFRGAVNEHGRLVLDTPHDFARYLHTLHATPVEIVVRPRHATRSVRQNAYWHAVPVTIMAEFMGDDHMAAHYALLGECWGYHYNPRVGRMVPNKPSSRHLSTADFAHMIQWCPPWAMQTYHVNIPLPDEVEYDDAPV